MECLPSCFLFSTAGLTRKHPEDFHFNPHLGQLSCGLVPLPIVKQAEPMTKLSRELSNPTIVWLAFYNLYKMWNLPMNFYSCLVTFPLQPIFFQSELLSSYSFSEGFQDTQLPRERSQQLMIQRQNVTENKIPAVTQLKASSKLLLQQQRRKANLKKKKEAEEDFQAKTQDKKRNCLSNTLKMFISWLYSHTDPQYFFQSNLPKNLPILAADFFQQLEINIKVGQNYIRPAIFQEICQGSHLSPTNCLLFRMLLKRFLSYEQVPLLNQKKMTKKCKHMQIKSARLLIRKLFPVRAANNQPSELSGVKEESCESETAKI